MEMLTCRPLPNKNLYDALRRLNRYGRMTSFPKSDISLQNLRKMLRVRSEVVHLTISCDWYQALASQSLSLLAATDNKLTRLPLHPQSASTSTANLRSSTSQSCSHCNRKGHSERNCWKLHPDQKPSRGQLFQYLQELMIHEEQHMARPAGKRPTRPGRAGSLPRVTPEQRAAE